MRSVPRISSDMNQINRPDPEIEFFIEEHKPKQNFFATRRDFLKTTFIEDPQLVLKRQKELEKVKSNSVKDNSSKNNHTSPSISLLSTSSENPPPSLKSPPQSPSIKSPPPPSPKKNRKVHIQILETEPRPIIKLTRSEINQVVDRLTSTNENLYYSTRNSRNNIINDENTSPIRKKRDSGDSDAVFERLYFESTKPQKENKQVSDIPKRSDFIIPESDEEIISKSIALQKIKEMIDSSFPDKPNLTLKELYDIFINLGILDHCEKIEKIPQILNVIDKWKIRNTDLCDSSIIKNVLIQSILGRKGKFKHFARERMVSALANRKNNENNGYDSNQPLAQANRSKTLTQETFDRLISPRPIFSSPKNEEEDLNDTHFELSPQTQKILKISKYGNSTLEERDKELTERAMAKIEEIRQKMEKERIIMQNSHHASKSHISKKDRAKIEELKLKRQHEIENENKQPFKPDVMKYSDFLKIKEAMNEEKAKPPGIDAFLDRMRKGHEKFLKNKFDEENIQAHPQKQLKRISKKE